ncbi:LOW QUALITY PROTEIN: Senescence/spartin-associated, C-terminal [Dillenia turbinata]|uniref:Senescence/spartin-associated, C-terminal n=1 Tax=Dillenia turbinata TaxID=194707 RepID=A0AAN8Z2Y6_9MAGN
MIEKTCAAYGTTLAPNVEDYSAGSGQLIKGILWCGDVTVDRLKWGDEVLKKKINLGQKAEISLKTLKRIKRHGEAAAKETSEGLDAAGHEMSAAWAIFKIRNGINPKSVLKPLAKSGLKAAAESAKKSKRSD